MKINLRYTACSIIILHLFVLTCCNTTVQNNKNNSDLTATPTSYAPHSDSARYVGINTCKLCHQDIYTSFIKTGMGSSFHLASESNSKAIFNNNTVYDTYSNYYYRAYTEKDSIYISEFRLQGKDTVYRRYEQINYIVGSGQHTNSHIQNINGYLHQMPITYYTQAGKWDMPPGFENGFNTRFTRRIGLECMSCHNAFPDFEMGSENKFRQVPQGIDCERCHGPGSIHVAEKQAGIVIDTATQIDYSIVNPAKLPINLQFDICQRCHLQGNAVLKNNHSFFDFIPGKKLSDYISVFLPRYSGSEDEFIMASHADRLKQSACFIKSIEKTSSANQLKPYKQAITCVTCHNPHQSVKETNTERYNAACINCHSNQQKSSKSCNNKKHLQAISSGSKKTELTSCVNCHMPRSGSIDVPHVTVHDHYIRKPVSKLEQNKIKTFLGLYAINEKTPNALTQAKAYLQQYEKFEQNKTYLDSAQFKLNHAASGNLNVKFRELIFLYFLKKEYTAIVKTVNELGEEKVYHNYLIKSSYDNRDAWTAYQIAEAWVETENIIKAEKWLKKCCQLAPLHPDFTVKYAHVLALLQKNNQAIELYEKVLKLNPKNTAALSNLGYLKLLGGDRQIALTLYLKALDIDPDYEAVLLNLCGYYLSNGDKNKALEYVNKIVSRNPKNKTALNVQKQIQALN